jgi:type 1 glutamine amidotransferase
MKTPFLSQISAFFIVCLFTFISVSSCQASSDEIVSSFDKPLQDIKVLVFTKTDGFEHRSIPTGVEALKKLGKENGFEVTETRWAYYFQPDTLEKYDVVVFLSTTQDVLGKGEQEAFKAFINNGGGFVGIHAAADTEYDWEWYGQLVGAYFKSHPKQQNALVKVTDKSHLSTSHLPSEWKRWDEWYNYKNIQSDLNVLAYLDESTYEGGENGDTHPIVWYHDFDGGRAFYTGFGHTDERYQDPLFLQHVLGGIMYAAGVDKFESK